MNEPAEERISYRAKDLFERIDTKLDTIGKRLEELASGKADVALVVSLEARLRSVESLAEKQEQLHARTVPQFDRMQTAMDEHLRLPHSAMSKQDDRISALERWQAAQVGVAALIWKLAPLAVSIAAILYALHAGHPSIP